MTQSRASYEAIANYITNLQKLVSCVTPSVITAELHQPAPTPHSLTINYGEPVLLSDPPRLQLALRQYFLPSILHKVRPGRYKLVATFISFWTLMEEKFWLITGIPAATALSPLPICT